MNAALIIALCLALGGCAIADRLANGAVIEPSGEVIEPNGEVIEPNGEVIPSSLSRTADVRAAEIVAAENDMCLARARHFKGLVRVPCDQIAREPAP
jgi:hypothetical protein